MGSKTQEVSRAIGAPPKTSGTTLFGAPIGDLGWFASLLIASASGFMAFFAATFCGIIGITIYNSASRGKLDYSYSYYRLGLPVGLVVLSVALVYLGTLWVRRQTRQA